jgi:hypothetical protein
LKSVFVSFSYSATFSERTLKSEYSELTLKDREDMFLGLDLLMSSGGLLAMYCAFTDIGLKPGAILEVVEEDTIGEIPAVGDRLDSVLRDTTDACCPSDTISLCGGLTFWKVGS